MFLTVLGLPVPRVRNLLQDTAAALGTAGMRVDVVEPDGLLRLATHSVSTRTAHAIALVTYADSDWARVLGTANVAFVYLHADPMPFVEGHANQLDGVRAAMLRLASFAELLTSPNCLTIDTEHSDAAATLLDILRNRFDVPKLMPSQTAAESDTEPGKPGPTSDGELGATIRVALRGFEGLADRVPPSSILVSRLLFYDATRDIHPVDGPIDATGRSRVLLFGPSIYLPRGAWRARAVVAFSEQLVGQTFGIEIVTGSGTSSLEKKTFDVEVPGRQDIIVEFAHDNHAIPIEVRLSSQRGVFDGTLSLGYVEFSAIERVSSAAAAPAGQGPIRL